MSRRLTILSEEEIEDLYSLSRFTEEDRHLYFDLSVSEREMVFAIHTLLSSTFKRNLRQLFSNLNFAGRVEDAPLLNSIAFLKRLLREGKSPKQTNHLLFPTKVIPKSVHRYLFCKENKALESDRYEFLIYRLLRN